MEYHPSKLKSEIEEGLKEISVITHLAHSLGRSWFGNSANMVDRSRNCLAHRQDAVDKIRKLSVQGLSATTTTGWPAPRRSQTHTNSDLQILLRRMEHQNSPDVETENGGCVASSMTIKAYVSHNREVVPSWVYNEDQIR
jgi:uncharacterized protein YoaH (UPF0181 family)